MSRKWLAATIIATFMVLTLYMGIVVAMKKVMNTHVTTPITQFWQHLPFPTPERTPTYPMSYENPPQQAKETDVIPSQPFDFARSDHGTDRSWLDTPADPH